MTLHIMTQRLTKDYLALSYLKPNDGLLFIGDGSYSLLLEEQMATLQQNHACYVLTQEIAAKGLQLIDGVTAISYDNWVDLTSQYKQTVTW